MDGRTSWWEVVDALYDHGDIHSATLAQRQAVPTLADLAAVSREQQFVDLYGGKRTEDGEPLLDAFSRMISESLRSYPILALPTAFDLGEAKSSRLTSRRWLAADQPQPTTKRRCATCWHAMSWRGISI